MSRRLEIDGPDPVTVSAKRAFTAFRRIGRVQEYEPSGFVEGKVYIMGIPALVTVEWRPDPANPAKTLLDISATSGDELSRAADQALYLFARTFKAIQPGELLEPDDVLRRDKTKRAVQSVVLAAVAGALGYYFGLPWLNR